jgi:Tfp pilus assembly protein PilN
MTALALPPAAADVPFVHPAGRVIPQPLAVVFADLLPDEVRAKRRLRYAKRRMLFGLIALVLLLGLGDALTRQQTSAAEDDLASANAQVAISTNQIGKFSAVLNTQSETQQIRTQLAGALVNDVSWTSLLDLLRHDAPTGLRVTSVVGQVDDPGSAAGTSDPTAGLTTTSDAVIGSLTLSGSAPNYSSVAGYVIALSGTKGFTAVNPATVTTAATGHQLAFTLTMSLTTSIDSEHYTASSATPPTTQAATTQAPATQAATTQNAVPQGSAAPGASTTGSPHHASPTSTLQRTSGSKKIAKHKSPAPALAPVGN